MTGGAMSQPEILDIEIIDEEFHVDDGRVVAIFYVDSEEHKRQGEDGRSIKTTATRKGNAVVVDEERNNGRMTIESTRRYELSPDGETMVVTLQIKPPSSKEPMVIRSVYDLVE